MGSPLRSMTLSVIVGGFSVLGMVSVLSNGCGYCQDWSATIALLGLSGYGGQCYVSYHITAGMIPDCFPPLIACRVTSSTMKSSPHWGDLGSDSTPFLRLLCLTNVVPSVTGTCHQPLKTSKGNSNTLHYFMIFWDSLDQQLKRRLLVPCSGVFIRKSVPIGKGYHHLEWHRFI